MSYLCPGVLASIETIERLFRLDMRLRELYEIKLPQIRPTEGLYVEKKESSIIKEFMRDISPNSVVLVKDTYLAVLREIALLRNEFYQKSGKEYEWQAWLEDSQMYMRVGSPEEYTPNNRMYYPTGTDINGFIAALRSNLEKTKFEPLKISTREWIFNDYLYEVDGLFTDEQFKLLVYEHFDQERRMFEKLKQKFTSSDNDNLSGIDRRIPEKVRIEVWRRDGGKCARCGSREKLEYDHVVPVSKGGSNTARNVELLCEKCNRSKSDNVA